MMSPEQVERALEEGRALGMRQVYYTGGEPFLHPQIRRLTELALSLAPLTIVTNGLLLDDATVRWLASTFERSRYSLDLRVSLDGMTREQNDRVRGRGTFDEIASALKRLGRAGLSPVVTAVEHEEGLAGEEARKRFLEFIRSLGIRQPRLKLLPLLRIGREERRTHGYELTEALNAEMISAEVEASLLCADSRAVSAHGVFTCPILVKHESARMGDRLADGARAIRLQWSACQTCVLDGLRCNT
jgi:molybdenum cofactor biosynthesis enzyme MoaA